MDATRTESFATAVKARKAINDYKEPTLYSQGTTAQSWFLRPGSLASPGKGDNVLFAISAASVTRQRLRKGAQEGDQLLIFSLMPASLPAPPPDALILALNSDQQTEVRPRAIAAGKDVAPVRMSKAEYRARGATVARYVLSRARAGCEACDLSAPFCRADGTPFLEVHHLRQLADDGPGDIRHVAGICPNCHRQTHFGPDLLGFREQLERKISIKEDAANLKCGQSAT